MSGREYLLLTSMKPAVGPRIYVRRAVMCRCDMRQLLYEHRSERIGSLEMGCDVGGVDGLDLPHARV